MHFSEKKKKKKKKKRKKKKGNFVSSFVEFDKLEPNR